MYSNTPLEGDAGRVFLHDCGEGRHVGVASSDDPGDGSGRKGEEVFVGDGQEVCGEGVCGRVACEDAVLYSGPRNSDQAIS